MIMKQEIIDSIENSEKLEELYRSDPTEFSEVFREVYNFISGFPAAEFWKTRLRFDYIAAGKPVEEYILRSESVQVIPGGKFTIVFTIIASLIAGTLAKMPDFFGFPEDPYIPNNIAFFVLPFLILYYVVKNNLQIKPIVLFSITLLLSVIFINMFPGVKSDTHMLSQIHLVLLMWILLGISFTGGDYRSSEKILHYFKRNGDVIIMTAIILFAGVLLAGLTQGLFHVIKVPIESYFKYIVIYGLCAAPIVANYMIESTPGLVNKVAPFVSKIFLPLVLIMMTCFLVALIFFANDPFNNREELIVFNALLVFNLAIIFFSFSGQKVEAKSYLNKIIFFLSAEAILINSIAISAIVYRLFAMGISPNRIAVLGGNILMFINLIIIAVKLYKYIRNKTGVNEINDSMTFMMPYYAIWATFISFVFPFIFWFK